MNSYCLEQKSNLNLETTKNQTRLSYVSNRGEIFGATSEMLGQSLPPWLEQGCVPFYEKMFKFPTKSILSTSFPFKIIYHCTCALYLQFLSVDQSLTNSRFSLVSLRIRFHLLYQIILNVHNLVSQLDLTNFSSVKCQFPELNRPTGMMNDDRSEISLFKREQLSRLNLF